MVAVLSPTFSVFVTSSLLFLMRTKFLCSLIVQSFCVWESVGEHRGFMFLIIESETSFTAPSPVLLTKDMCGHGGVCLAEVEVGQSLVLLLLVVVVMVWAVYILAPWPEVDQC